MKDKKAQYIKRLKTYMEEHKRSVYTVITILTIAIAGVYFFSRKNTIVLDIGSVQRLNLVKTIMASGKVISNTDLALSFQASDIVRSINYKVGDQVKKGDVIATLSNSAQQANLTKARGQLLGAQARLEKVIEGASAVDISAAADALASTKRTQDRLVENAFRKLMSDDLTAEPQRNDMDPAKSPIVSGTYLGSESGMYDISLGISQSDVRYTGLESGSLVVNALQQSLGNNGLSVTFPSTNYSYSDEWIIRVPNTTGKNYTANLNAYNAALATRDQAISDANSKLTVTSAKSRNVDIAAAEADVVSAKGALEAAQADLEKTIVRAPADGTITKIDVRLGDLVTINQPVIALQDIGHLYIQANVNESDIVGLAVGQPVSITYEALGKSNVYTGAVSEVNLGATINSGIVNYQIKASIDDVTNIKPGMTADIIVQTAKIDNALVLPSRFIHDGTNGKSVNIITDVKNMKTAPRAITTGLRGDGGYVEIVSGLVAGDQVAADPTTL